MVALGMDDGMDENFERLDTVLEGIPSLSPLVKLIELPAEPMAGSE